MTFMIAFALLLAATPPPACQAPEYRQFDFWIGEWEVKNPAGKVAGTNRISKISGGCGLLEEWTGAGGVTGKSINAWDASRKQWHQTWVGADGTVLHLDGAFSDGRMRLENATDRITWTPNPDGTVRQHWEKPDQSGAWKTVFDGTYAKKRGD
jgi:hypothetical protein